MSIKTIVTGEHDFNADAIVSVIHKATDDTVLIIHNVKREDSNNAGNASEEGEVVVR